MPHAHDQAPGPESQRKCGQFLQNPVISSENAKAFLAGWPTAPHYPQADGSVKLAAGWLIDQCELKGTTLGGAAVHRQQALVLINQSNATSEDVVNRRTMFVSAWAKIQRLAGA